MSEWTWQIPFSVIGGGALFAVLLVPALLVEYRRFGRLSVPRLLVAAAGCVYAVALAAYTLLPLPPVVEACPPGSRGGILNARPLAFIGDIAEVAGRIGLPRALTSFTTLQVVLNVVLFVPLGLLLRGFRGRGLPATVLVGLSVSLLIEATQYTGDWGLYPCGYRVADVDDLLANTLGALLGGLAAPLLLGSWVPSARRLAASGRAAPHPVGALRRLLGMLLDWAGIGMVGLILTIAWMAWQDLVGGVPADRLRPLSLPLATGGDVLAALLILYVPALIGGGASLGQRLVSITPVFSGPHIGGADRGVTRGTGAQRIARASVVGGVYVLGRTLPDLLASLGVPVLPTLLDVATSTWILAAVIAAALGAHRGLSGLLTGARMVDVRELRTGRTPAGASDGTSAAAAAGGTDRPRV